ncbi:hypothetical protein [Blastopirellula marina]|uniref:Uncharacterized protein n=1 Tax=Blastopirellula marina TaxID=124 RepID=A0A2S8F4J6_9BACT|nr:hypothetical protein [Blastopirellula marina]PQO27085.1 hypothetical protein C5Y98_27935 [Blastopirellula marina]PTL41232.1 hypothetical protein C5Y97_27950 [Blastopirellula marina]
MDESRSDQPFRFDLKDLLLATGILGYLCGLVSLGVSGIGWGSIRHLAIVFEMAAPAFFAWPFVFFGSLAMLLVIPLSDNPNRRPKLFLLLNLAVVLAACCLPLIHFFWGWIVPFESLTVCFGLGAFPLSIAWLVHRWALEMPLSPAVSRTFYLLMFLDLAATVSGIGLCVIFDF